MLFYKLLYNNVSIYTTNLDNKLFLVRKFKDILMKNYTKQGVENNDNPANSKVCKMN